MSPDDRSTTAAVGSGAAAALLELLRERSGEITDLTARLARAESPTGDVPAHREAFAVLAAELEEIGLAVRAIAGDGVGPHLYARPASRTRRSPFQLVLGHLDTVWSLGTVASMPVRVENGLLHGPGVVDMKAGLALAAHALRALRDLGLAPPATPVVLVTSDEETGSVDSKPWIFRLAGGAARTFVLEAPSGSRGLLKTARKGVGHYRVVVRGRAAHAGGAPEQGASAILELSHQVQRLFALNDPARGVTVNVGTIDGGTRPNVIAPEASCEVDVRIPTLEEAERLHAAILGLAPVGAGVEVLVEGGLGRPPLEPTPRNVRLFERARELGALIGLEIEGTAVGGASDGNYTSLLSATLDGLGAVGGGAHALDEHVVVASLAERAALLALLLLAPVDEA